MKRQFLSILLAICMVLCLVPTSALAADEEGTAAQTETRGLCEHHQEHNSECGYSEGTAGSLLLLGKRKKYR